jgi:magnesium transporter
MSPHKPSGLPPGTIVYTGKNVSDKIRFSVIAFNEKEYFVYESENWDEIKKHLFEKPDFIYWLNIDGVHIPEVLQSIGEFFHLHPLTLEDIANVNQRPKTDEYENYIYSVLKMIDVRENAVMIEQVSLILVHGAVLTFQENPSFDVFTPIRQRILQGKGRVRKMKEDYLFYVLLDCIVDSYFHVAEYISDRIEVLEESIVDEQNQTGIQRIYEVKREILFIKKQLWPVRDLIAFLTRSEHPLISKSIRIYLRDIQDHMYRILETIENDRELTSSILDVHLSNHSFRMNEIMKVLTLISTLFIPVTFIVGVYGMNFDYMPELRMKYGYLAVWIVIVIIIAGNLYYFRKKKWI